MFKSSSLIDWFNTNLKIFSKTNIDHHIFHTRKICFSILLKMVYSIYENDRVFWENCRDRTKKFLSGSMSSFCLQRIDGSLGFFAKISWSSSDKIWKNEFLGNCDTLFQSNRWWTFVNSSSNRNKSFTSCQTLQSDSSRLSKTDIERQVLDWKVQFSIPVLDQENFEILKWIFRKSNTNVENICE